MPPNQMMDVGTAHGDVLEWPDVVLNGSHQQAHGQKSDEETDRRQEHPAVRLVGEIVVDDVAQPGEMEQQQHGCRYHHDEHQQDPGAFPMHTVLNHLSGLAMLDFRGER